MPASRILSIAHPNLDNRRVKSEREIQQELFLRRQTQQCGGGRRIVRKPIISDEMNRPGD